MVKKYIINRILESVMTLLLTLDGIIYNFISWFYEIFMYLAKLNLFSNEDYESIVRRIYIVLGVIMLFVLSYSLLKAIINPDEYAKGEKSFINIIKNVIVSLVIIVVLPTIFDVAFRVQTVVLNYDVIGRLILDENVGTGAIENGGRTISTNVFRAFFSVNPDAQTGDYASDYNNIRGAVASAFDEVSNRDASFLLFSGEYRYNGKSFSFPELVVGKAISYTFLISHLAGAFVLWCILLFCFDLGIRVIKLIYFQMIAPIAVACRVIPGSKAKEIFPNWLKKTVSTFLEVFIRIFIMYLGVYLITLLVDKFPDVAAAGENAGLDFVQRLLVKAFLIMGVVAFIRQAPRLIQDVFGFETGGINLGLRGLTERFGNGGGFAVANGLGGLITGRGVGGMLRGLRYGWSNNNLRGIGREAERHRLDRLARQHGATTGGIMWNRIRMSLGFDSTYDAEIRRIDESIKAEEELKEQAQEQLRRERVKERSEGNANYNKIFDAAKSRAETLVLREDATNTTATFTFTGTDGQTYTIGGTNLYAFNKYLNEHSNVMTGNQIQTFGNYLRDQTKAEVKNIFDATSQSITDHQNNPNVALLDAELANHIMDLRQDHVIRGTLMDADGNSDLANDAARVNAMNSSTGLYDTLDSVNNDVLGAQHDLSQIRSRTDADVAEIDRRIANLQAGKSTRDMSRRRYEADTSRRHQQGGGQNNGGGQ